VPDSIRESADLPQISRKSPQSTIARGVLVQEAMERTKFLRKQADRFLRLAQECTDPEIRRQLLSMADEYRTMLDVLEPDRQAGLGKAS
jgi:hypothetical protein